MKLQLKSFLSLFVVLAMGSGSLFSRELIPVEKFFENSEFSSFSVSPDGESMLAIAPVEGVDNIFIMDVETQELQLLTSSKEDVVQAFWVNDERIMYSVEADKDDAVSTAGGWMAVNKDGENFRIIQEPYRYQTKNGSTYKPEFISIINRLHHEPDYILIESNKRRAKYPDVYRLNVYNGKKDMVLMNPDEMNGFITSIDGQVRFAVEYGEDDDSSKTIYFLNNDEEWEEVLTVDRNQDNAYILTAEEKTKTAYFCHNLNRDKMAVFKFDMNTGILDSEPMYEDDVYDVSPDREIIHRNAGLFAGFTYQKAKPELVSVFPGFKRLMEMVDAQLPGTFNYPYSYSNDFMRIVVRSYSDTEQPFFSLLDLKSQSLMPLSRGTRFEEGELCETQPVQWTAEDGRTIHGYLTLPNDWSKESPSPMVLRIHGGPWAREEWGLTWHYPMERQYFANRGFAVLEVNFRGSTGYGKDHLISSYKHPKEMATDWVAGVEWAIENGYAQKGKVGIVGASWGGYSTMVGVTKFPDMFCFGINFMGVVDLVEHINWYRFRDASDTAYYHWVHRIGDPRDPKELKMLKEWSPINYVDDIQCPLFVYHGLRDMNVDIEQAYMLKAALKRADVDFEDVIRTDEAHSTHYEADRIDTYKRIDEFLRKHGFID